VNDTCAEFENAIADFVDDALDERRRAMLERHVEQCTPCRELVGNLLAIRQAARQLTPLTPPVSLWARIEGAIRGAGTPAAPVLLTGRRSRATWTITVADPQTRRFATAAALLLAAGAAVAIAVIGWRALTAPNSGASPDDYLAVIAEVEADLREAEGHYEAALRGLEALSAATNDAVDADLAATLHDHLMLMDQMIAESRAALVGQPTSKPAQASLVAGLRRKYALLHDAVMMLDVNEPVANPQ